MLDLEASTKELLSYMTKSGYVTSAKPELTLMLLKISIHLHELEKARGQLRGSAAQAAASPGINP